MTDLEEFESKLEEPLRSSINEVLEAIKEEHNLKDITIITPLNEDLVIEFLEKRSIPIVSGFKSALNTPFAIGKYLLLLDQQNSLHERLDKIFKEMFDLNEIVWMLPKDLSNKINFVKNDECPNNLYIKYSLDTNDNFKFVIDTGSVGWPVTLEQLKAILTSNFESYPQGYSIKSDTNTKEDITITVGNKTIVIKDNS